LKNYKHYVILIALIGILGCSQNVKFGGRVTYSDDGSPLTTGVVCFESSSFLARGELDQEGRYDMGSVNLKDGIPKGEYRVYISGADAVETVELVHASGQANHIVNPGTSGTMGGRTLTPLIAPKFTAGKTSGISVTIDGSSKKFDFQVDRPQPQK